MLAYKIMFSILFSLLFFPFVSFAVDTPQNTQATPAELQSASNNLGMITVQRGMLEALKLDVQLQEETNKLNELQMTVPNQSLLKSLEVPPVDTADTINDSNELLSVHGLEGSLSAKIKFRGKLTNVKHGQMFNGERVKISRDKVSFGSVTLFLE